MIKNKKKRPLDSEATDSSPKKAKKIEKTSNVPKKNSKFAEKGNCVSNGEKCDWKKLKEEKKELRLKRKKAKGMFEISLEAKKVAENLQRKRTNDVERKKLALQLHKLLFNKGEYAKFVLVHDMARVVQSAIKFGTPEMREEISKELVPLSIQMLQSKYGRYVLKNLLKYGTSSVRSAIVESFYGHAVNLTSHALSAQVFEYAYSNWATPLQKQHLQQEFFGDIYRQTKDDSVKHLTDMYRNDPVMKIAALGATKANLSRVLNKDLLDSGLIQTVLYEFINECTSEDRMELIDELNSHIAILSNSKNGARVAMNCIWHGSAKHKKGIMKAVKDHLIDLCNHEHGHCIVITLLDATDDTVLLNKIILSQIFQNCHSIAENEWGRKVLLWLVAPGDSAYFHPLFIKEIDAGRNVSTCKKAVEIRRKELLHYSSPTLLSDIANDSQFWLSTPLLTMLTAAILKAVNVSGLQNELKEALEGVAKIINDQNWKIKEDGEILGVEHAGYHMILKKIAHHDKLLSSEVTFGRVLLSVLSDETLKLWLTLNRGCFLLLAVFENNVEEVQEILKAKIKPYFSLLKKQTFAGAKILLKKLN